MTDLIAVDGPDGSGKTSTVEWLKSNTDAITVASKPAAYMPFYADLKDYDTPVAKDLLFHQMIDSIASEKARNQKSNPVFKDSYLASRMVEAARNPEIEEGRALEFFQLLGSDPPDINFYLDAEDEVLQERIEDREEDDWKPEEIQEIRGYYEESMEYLQTEFGTVVIPIDTSCLESAEQTGRKMVQEVDSIHLREEARREKAY